MSSVSSLSLSGVRLVVLNDELSNPYFTAKREKACGRCLDYFRCVEPGKDNNTKLDREKAGKKKKGQDDGDKYSGKEKEAKIVEMCQQLYEASAKCEKKHGFDDG